MKKCMKILAAILVILMALQMCPLSGIADELDEDLYEDSGEIIIEEPDESIPDDIIIEDENESDSEEGGDVDLSEGDSDVLPEDEIDVDNEKRLPDEGEILFEDRSKRESNAKHFRMSNGQYLAAVYPYPVH